MYTSPYRALVVGATGAIGGAFVRAFESDPGCEAVHTLSRQSHPGFDMTDEASMVAVLESLREHAPFDVVIDATGGLTIQGLGPEKSLAAIQPDALRRSFDLNALGPILLLRHLAPLLSKGPAVWGKLSARVGSIADNSKGGWYGYRAAKAALNMYLQTAAIELQRKNPQLRVLALQPGTVRSSLSTPFAASVPHLLEPDESVAGLMQALRAAPVVSGAQFVDWQGQAIPW